MDKAMPNTNESPLQESTLATPYRGGGDIKTRIAEDLNIGLSFKIYLTWNSVTTAVQRMGDQAQFKECDSGGV